MKPPRPLRPTTLWALCTHEGKLALGIDSMILTYRTRKEAFYDVSTLDGERVVKILITEVTK